MPIGRIPANYGQAYRVCPARAGSDGDGAPRTWPRDKYFYE